MMRLNAAIGKQVTGLLAAGSARCPQPRRPSPGHHQTGDTQAHRPSASAHQSRYRASNPNRHTLDFQLL
jgi:hypothetical protein